MSQVLKFPVLTVLLLFTLSMDALSLHYIITLALLVDVSSLLSYLSLHSRSTESLVTLFSVELPHFMLRFHRTCLCLTIVFLFTSTLADALRSMDVSRDSQTRLSRSPCHVPLARVLVRSRSRLTRFPFT